MNHERVASLLASGLQNTQVATIIGCSPARISQLLKEESFQLILASKQEEINKEDIEETSLSAKYAAAEHTLIQQVMDMAPSSELRDVTAALRVVGDRQEKMKSRLSPVQQLGTVQQTLISISIPSHALPTPAIQMTSQGEVTSIGNNTLAPLTSTAVTNLFSKMRTEEKGEYHDTIPSIENSKGSSKETIPTETINEGSFLAYAGT